ncbi:MAG: recombinase family protein [Pirellula sp.]|jgi:DNA invertase Pin-like site-specific DNA recombinase|nr:recombinase family protein [Pirellula sp.]
MKNNSVVTVLGQHSPSARAVAYFRSSSQVGHEHAISSQQDHVRQWAEEHGIEIIHEFCDIGPSGPDTKELPALRVMLDEWVKPRSDFELVLCVDANRLGRCVSGDFAEQPSEVVHQHRKRLIYTSTNEPQPR